MAGQSRVSYSTNIFPGDSMFNQLLESKAKKEKLAGGTLFSMILHGGLIAAAVTATAARASPRREKAENPVRGDNKDRPSRRP